MRAHTHPAIAPGHIQTATTVHRRARWCVQHVICERQNTARPSETGAHAVGQITAPRRMIASTTTTRPAPDLPVDTVCPAPHTRDTVHQELGRHFSMPWSWCGQLREPSGDASRGSRWSARTLKRREALVAQHPHPRAASEDIGTHGVSVQRPLPPPLRASARIPLRVVTQHRRQRRAWRLYEGAPVREHA